MYRTSYLICVQEKVPYMCAGKGTLYVCRKRYLICVQGKLLYMFAGKGTLHVYRTRYLTCVQDKVPYIHMYTFIGTIYLCTSRIDQEKLPYMYRKRYLIYIDIHIM